MKYKVGDRVKVRSWDDMAKEYGVVNDGIKGPYGNFVSNMKIYCGKYVTIVLIFEDKYCIKEDGYCWCDWMFEDEPKSNLEKVMDILGIKKDIPISIYSEEGELLEGSPYILNDGNLIDSDGDNANYVIYYLLMEEYTFKETPKKFPQRNDDCFVIYEDGDISRTYFSGSASDLALLYMGNMFKTEEEAEAHKDEIMEKYKKVKESMQC